MSPIKIIIAKLIPKGELGALVGESDD